MVGRRNEGVPVIHTKWQRPVMDPSKEPHCGLNVTAISAGEAVPKMKTDGATLSKITLKDSSVLHAQGAGGRCRDRNAGTSCTRKRRGLLATSVPMSCSPSTMEKPTQYCTLSK